MTVRLSDGTAVRYAADKPVLSEVAVTWPDPLRTIGRYPDLEPQPIEVNVSFSAHPQHGITINRDTAAETPEVTA